ncbi:GNAT family N-acetyltransferase [Bdellovibrio reynosensis]|uniref:GNAT family N-acetyltransferase n=1 Tax=Bdellovibrio reynosensis TaxID=2835041 RepID=A0ABY4CIV9_9BACT|nr:GNAT family N-acetyltransferase [Bdellovibrio reynosensis]UOF02170.1 GNAT family N-acetyltransferase [Bdellovibrio reynosensis]
MKREFETGRIEIIQAGNTDFGYLHLAKTEEKVQIVNILILPEHQGKGLGTTIIKDLIAKTKSANMTLELGVFKINTKAKSLYEKLGFKTFNETKTHYQMRI